MQTTCDPMIISERERELGAMIHAYSDVTEQLKEAHERLNREVVRLREELERKNAELRRREQLAALGEMAAGLAHEVRNPLGGMALYSSMLERELEGQERAHTAAVRISQEVRSLDRLVSEILDFAQEDRLQRQRCKLGVVLSEVQDSIRSWTDQCQCIVTINPSAFEVELSCDPPRLRQVLMNLLVNSCQAVAVGGHVRLSAEDSESNEGKAGEVRIEISDDGPGIPAEQMDRIFHPFYTTKAQGTGLGLAIVHRIVESHGGVIRASNRPEGGARFIVSLPAVGAESSV